MMSGTNAELGHENERLLFALRMWLAALHVDQPLDDFGIETLEAAIAALATVTAGRDAALAATETPEQIRDRLLPVVLSYAAAGGLSDLGKVQAALRLGAQAGIQSAQKATS